MRFESNEEVEREKKGYFGGVDKSYYFEGIENLKDSWTSCIELKSILIVKLRSFQNASIEIKQIYFV